jgi:lipopolysaccharide biosynthesis glycosyltransferase
MLSGFDGQQDGTNAFIYSRYLVPYLCDFNGWAIFCDGDMVVNEDIAVLWDEKDNMTVGRGVGVVQHNYKTKFQRKYIGTRMQNANVDYPRKNWSSVMLWNCGFYPNRILTPEFVGTAGGKFLHRFEWLNDEQIYALPRWWNHLVNEDAPGGASLYHYTLGVPGIKHYADDTASWKWHRALIQALECAGENEPAMVKRAEDRVGE